MSPAALPELSISKKSTDKPRARVFADDGHWTHGRYDDGNGRRWLCPIEACPQRDHARADFHIRNVATPLFRRLHSKPRPPVRSSNCRLASHSRSSNGKLAALD
jgi:hypothetical protein